MHFYVIMCLTTVTNSLLYQHPNYCLLLIHPKSNPLFQRKFGQEVAEYSKASSESETEILKCLATSRDNLLTDTHAIKKLYNMKKLHTEALENLENSRNSETNVLKSREAYRPLAVRAAVIYRTSMLMARVNPLYQWSLLQFLPVFESSVKQSDR